MSFSNQYPSVAPEQYVEVKLRKDVLARLIASQALHADELKCYSVKSKKTVSAMLLNAAISGL